MARGGAIHCRLDCPAAASWLPVRAHAAGSSLLHRVVPTPDVCHALPWWPIYLVLPKFEFYFWPENCWPGNEVPVSIFNLLPGLLKSRHIFFEAKFWPSKFIPIHYLGPYLSNPSKSSLLFLAGKSGRPAKGCRPFCTTGSFLDTMYLFLVRLAQGRNQGGVQGVQTPPHGVLDLH